MIFVDSDILLDIAFKRLPFFDSSAEFIDLAIKDEIRAGTSPIVISNVHYLIEKNRDSQIASSFCKGILKYIDFYPHNKEDFINAFQSNFNDKEDAINYFTARRHGIEYIITRNIRDFKRSEIPVLTPSEYLARIAR